MDLEKSVKSHLLRGGRVIPHPSLYDTVHCCCRLILSREQTEVQLQTDTLGVEEDMLGRRDAIEVSGEV